MIHHIDVEIFVPPLGCPCRGDCRCDACDCVLLSIELAVGMPTRATRHCPGDGGDIDVQSISDDRGNVWTIGAASLLMAWSTLIETGTAVGLDEYIETKWHVIMDSAGDQWADDRDDAMVARWEARGAT